MVAPKLGELARIYPDIVLDITSEDSRTDIVAGGFDAGIHFGEYIQKDMIAVRVSQDHRPAIVASPQYLAGRTKPKIPRDLLNHRCINFRHGSAGLYRWEFEKGRKALALNVNGPLIVEDAELVRRAALDGVGFAFLSERDVDEHLREGSLVRVLEDWCQPYPGFFLYYPSRRQQTKALLAVIEVFRVEGASTKAESVGHRPAIDQRIQLAADASGKFTAIQQDYANHTSIADEYDEGCGEATGLLYSCPNVLVTSGMVRRNVGTPTSMRGPGAVPGLFALESAIDELTIKLKIDPVNFRQMNETQVDETTGKPFSSRHLQECLSVGAEKFGWAKRNAIVGSMKNTTGQTLGWGMAACSWGAMKIDAEASVELRADGTARVATGSQDIGTGTYTVIAQLVSHVTGLPVEKVEVVLGDSSLPPGPISGGSWATASLTPAVLEAARNATMSVLTVAVKTEGSPFKDKKPADLEFVDGAVRLKGQAAPSLTMSQTLNLANVKSVNASGKSKGTLGDPSVKFSSYSFGAQFAEVTWEPEIARLRVSRIVTVIDAGRMINPRAARNQIEGAVVMGVGMALLEATEYDQRNGAPTNNNLADYIVAVHADCPKIDVTFLDYPDYNLNPVGARGVGEIGLAGLAPAITNAVYHATGVRVRKLPVRIEDLLAAPVPAVHSI